MSDDHLSVASLSQDLSPAGRRRLWLVGKLIEHCNGNSLATAIGVAAQLEQFIVAGTPTGFADGLQPSAPGEASVPLSRGGHAARTSERSEGRRPLLDPATRNSFIREAAVNDDNRHLARKFGLTVRQAHAIRVGMAKEIAKLKRDPANGQAATSSAIAPPDRATELAMQEEFLRRKPAAAASMDDVVRYLRQSGDIVVSEGANYRVNSRLSLPPGDLIERANKKRRERGLASFSVPLTGNGLLPASEGDGTEAAPSEPSGAANSHHEGKAVPEGMCPGS